MYSFLKILLFSVLSIFKFTFKQNENLNKLMSKWTLMWCGSVCHCFVHIIIKFYVLTKLSEVMQFRFSWIQRGNFVVSINTENGDASPWYILTYIHTNIYLSTKITFSALFNQLTWFEVEWRNTLLEQLH